MGNVKVVALGDHLGLKYEKPACSQRDMALCIQTACPLLLRSVKMADVDNNGQELLAESSSVVSRSAKQPLIS